MFGLSLTKILFTALVVLAVWKGFALLGRHTAEKRASVADSAERRRQRRAQGLKNGAGPGGKGGTVELVPCPGCGAYIDARVGCARCAERERGSRPT